MSANRLSREWEPDSFVARLATPSHYGSGVVLLFYTPILKFQPADRRRFGHFRVDGAVMRFGFRLCNEPTIVLSCQKPSERERRVTWFVILGPEAQVLGLRTTSSRCSLTPIPDADELMPVAGHLATRAECNVRGPFFVPAPNVWQDNGLDVDDLNVGLLDPRIRRGERRFHRFVLPGLK